MKLCVLFGGRSGEHEVSLRSAASVIGNLDRARYEIVAIGIDKAGVWHLQDRVRTVTLPDQGESVEIVPSATVVAVVPGQGLRVGSGLLEVDCVFPVLHGTFGEDGTVQGLLDVAGLPYVGAGVLGSSVAMDKETAKRLWRDAGLPVVEFRTVDRKTSETAIREAARAIGYPLCVKPCASGSSLGVTRVSAEEHLAAATAEALRYDTRALLERWVQGREIECSVIGNATPRAFPPGEILTSGAHSFYDYDAKYVDPEGARLATRADLEPQTQERVMRVAEKAYAQIRCQGMARVDFFVESRSGEVFLNEINTIPGFTSISMFPRMCAASGLPYGQLLDTLIDLALERHAERQTVQYRK